MHQTSVLDDGQIILYKQNILVEFEVLIAVTVKNFCLLGYNAMESDQSQPVFWRNLSPPSSGLKSELTLLTQKMELFRIS
jgi:hypothetical protein